MIVFLIANEFFFEENYVEEGGLIALLNQYDMSWLQWTPLVKAYITMRGLISPDLEGRSYGMGRSLRSFHRHNHLSLQTIAYFPQLVEVDEGLIPNITKEASC